MGTCETKICSKCGKEKPLSDFYIGKNAKRINRCRECMIIADRERRSKKKKKFFWIESDWIYNPGEPLRDRTKTTR